MAALPPLAVSLIVSAATAAAGAGLSYLMREKGNQTPVDMGKMDDLRITGSEYGSVIPRVWGRARLGSNIIWSSGIQHRVIDYPSQGGKGVPQAPATRSHVYTADFGLQICRGPLSGFGKMWADAEVIGDLPSYMEVYEAEAGSPRATRYGTAADPSAVNSSPGASNGQFISRMGNIGSGSPGYIVFNVAGTPSALQYDPEADTTAFSSVEIYYKCNSTLTMNVKLRNVTNNITWIDAPYTFTDTDDKWAMLRVVWRDEPIAGNGVFVEEVTLGNGSASTAGPDIDRILVSKTWMRTTDPTPLDFTPTVTGFLDPYATYSDSLVPSGYFSALPTSNAIGETRANGLPYNMLVTYEGLTTQEPSEYLIDYLDTRYPGVGEDYAPAHRETALAVFHDYNLRQGRIPNYTFEVYNEKYDMSYVLTDLFTDCGLSATDYDLTGASAYTFVGLVDSQRQSRKAFLENVGKYFGFRLAEFNGKIQVIDNNNFTPTATISSDLLRARNEGSEAAAYDAEILISPTHELPQMIRFNVSNPDMEYHNETVQAFVQADVYSADTQDLNFPVIERPETARRKAELLLLKTYAENKSVTFTALPEVLKYSIGDIVNVTINDRTHVVRIEKLQAGLPIGVVTVEGFILERYDPSELVTVVQELPSTNTNQLLEMTFPRNSKAIPILSRPVRQIEKGRLGCYIAVTPMGYGESQNIALYMEQGADNYVIRDIFDVPSTCGVTDGTLGAASTQLDIFFYNNVSLESVTAGDLTRYPELNLIRIGNEWLQFQTATKLTLPEDSPYRSKWRISTFTRGLFATSGATGTHAASEDCTVFTNNLKWYDFRTQDVGQTVKVKTTTGGLPLEDVRVTSFTFNPVSAYTVTNWTEDRAFDANSTTINELADVVSTIIDDLKL